MKLVLFLKKLVRNLLNIFASLIFFSISVLSETVKVLIKRPIIFLLLIFGLWLNYLPLANENTVKGNVTVLSQNQTFYSSAEYSALISNKRKVNLVAFRGKILLNYNVNVDEKTQRLNADFRVLQRTPGLEGETLDLTASIPEDRILAKLYQLNPFGVKLPRGIDQQYIRNLPTESRVDFLRSRVPVKTLQQAYTNFAKHLNDQNTEVFLGKFGEKYQDTKTYKGFYGYNDITKNMMFFKEDPDAIGGYSLHAIMKLSNTKAEELKRNHSIF